MAEPMPGDPDAGDRLVRLDDGDMHVVQDGTNIRKAARTGFTRPVDIPDAFIEHVLGMTHRAFVGAMRAPLNYLGQRSLPDRLTPLGLPVLVIVGADDQRWRSSSAAAYRAVPGARVELLPGVGHTPMMENPQATGTLLLEFAAAAGHPPDSTPPSPTGPRSRQPG